MKELTNDSLRTHLIKTALEWQNRFGVAPAITSSVSEYDAAVLVGCSEDDLRLDSETRTAVTKGHDFVYRGARYQVKANRPSGKPGSKVTLVANPKNDEWDYLIWILYDTKYSIEEAWLWSLEGFRSNYPKDMRLHPDHLRLGTRMYPQENPVKGSLSYWIEGIPATFATKGEIPWRSTIIDSVPLNTAGGISGVMMDFTLPSMAPHGHPLDTDNLCQPVFYALKKIGYFEGNYANILWWRAKKCEGIPSGVSLTFNKENPTNLVELLGTPIFDEVYSGPLPSSATSPEIPQWLSSLTNKKNPNPESRLAISISFGSSKVSLGNISTGKVKSLIDCMFPIIGGKRGAPDDWKIDLIHAEKDPMNRDPASVGISVWEYRE